MQQPGLFSSPPVTQAPLPQDNTTDALWAACATAVAASLTLAATMSWSAGVPAAAGVKGFLMVGLHRLSAGVLFPASAPPWFALYTQPALIAIAVGAAVGGYLGWTLAFKKIDPAKHVRGKQLAEGKGETRYLLHAEVKREGAGIFLAPGLLAGAERVRRSIFLLGSIGGGKTQALLYLLKQLLGTHKLLFVDGPKGDMSRTIPDALIIAPWHLSAAWDIARDCPTRGHARELARRLIPVSEKDPLWGNAAGMIFVAILCKLQAVRGLNWGWSDIYEHVMMPIDALKKIAEIHYPPAVQAIADAESKTTQSIMINLTAFMADVMEMALAWRHTREKFSFLDWWQDENHAQKNVIIQTSGEYSALGQAYVSAIIGLLSNLTVSPSFPESKTRKNIVVIDEFAQLPKMPGFEKFLEIGRSKGVSAIIATQSPGQIKKIWGAEDLQAWFGMTGTRYFARVLGFEDQKFVLDELGQQDILTPSETITSAAGGGYSRSVTWQAQQRPVVPAERLESLGPRADGQGLDLLITGLPQPAIVQIPFTTMPDLRPAVVPNPDFNQQISLIALEAKPEQVSEPANAESPVLAGDGDGDNYVDRPAELNSDMVTFVDQENGDMVTNPENPRRATDSDDAFSGIPDFTEVGDGDNFTDPHPEPDTDQTETANPAFTWVEDGDISSKLHPEPDSDESPIESAAEHVVTDQVAEVAEHLTGTDGLGLALEIIEAAEGVTTPAGDGDNSRKSATRAKLQAAVATLKNRGGRVTQAAVAELAGVSLRTVKRQWQEVEGDI